MSCRKWVAVLALLSTAGVFAAADELQPPAKEPATAQTTSQEGTLVRAKGDKLVVSIPQAKSRAAEEKTFTLTPNARLFQGDRQISVAELRSGMHVRVTTTGVTNNVSRVEVLDKGGK
jgi:hypothetical protein